MRVSFAVVACAFLFVACSERSDDAPVAAATSEVAEAKPSEAPASAAPAEARKESVSNDLYEFEYAYPAPAASIPKLKSWFDADLEEQRRDLIKDGQEQLEQSKKNDFPYHPLGYWANWKVVTDLPGWLSLSGSISTYEGGAHPNHGFDALVWDRQANQRREPEDFFSSEDALSRAIRRDFCRELDKQREKKRGAPVKADSDDPFSECINPTDSTVILGSSSGKAFDRIGILVAPYEAGPYAEGDYEVTLPVTEAVMTVVKPEYRAAFAKGR